MPSGRNRNGDVRLGCVFKFTIVQEKCRFRHFGVAKISKQRGDSLGLLLERPRNSLHLPAAHFRNTPREISENAANARLILPRNPAPLIVAIFWDCPRESLIE